MIINGSINVKKINKDRLFEGKKGTYLDITILLKDEEDEYGNRGMIVESTSKEERENGERGTILGNVIIYEKKGVVNSIDNSVDENDGEVKGSDDPDNIPF